MNNAIDKITVKYKDDVMMKVYCSNASLRNELYSYFTFYVPGYRFMPKYKMGLWDGRVSLYKDNEMPVGLLSHLEDFAKSRDYEIEIDKTLKENVDISHQEFLSFIKYLNLPMEPRDYQILGAFKAIKNKRAIVLSPTGSGKSLIIYIIVRFLLEILPKEKKIMIVVPRISLVYQMYSDFKEYGFDVKKNVARIGGNSRDNIKDKRVVITTWQSVYKKKKQFFDEYGALIVDECHTLQNMSAKAVKSICYKTTQCPFKIGFTGTVKDLKVAKLELQGLLGKIYRVATTDDLIKKNVLSPIRIKCIRFVYNDDEKKEISKLDYNLQNKFVLQHQKRLDAITKLIAIQDKNCLVLFEYIDYGKNLYSKVKEFFEKSNQDRNVYLVYGDIDAETREEIRKRMEEENNSVLIASYGTFSTGINIKNIHALVFTTSGKSKIRVLQSIGRGLRTKEGKQELVLYDIFDDLTWKRKVNYSVKHFLERVKFYETENFPYEIVSINL